MLIKTSLGHICLKAGRLSSYLTREKCPFCDTEKCCYQCDGSKGEVQGERTLETEDEVSNRIYKAGFIDGIEELLLAIQPHISNLDPVVLGQVIDTAMEGMDDAE